MGKRWKSKKGRSILSLALAALLLTGCAGTGGQRAAPTVTATEEPALSPTPDTGPTPSPSPTPSPAPTDTPEPSPTALPVTAQELIQQYMEENGISSEQMYVGYYNTGTGEEAYVNGDVYREAASMYKVALCMYWTEKVKLGEVQWDEFVNGYKLEYSVQESLVNSNNDTAGALIGAIGSYARYRKAMIRFYGGVSEEEEEKFSSISAITPRQMIHALKMLYDQPEEYPRVLEYMSQANPREYFNLHPLPWKVAQKYGYLPQGGLVINVCGVIYTEQPFLLVVMTKSLLNNQVYMNGLAQLLGDYTEGRLPGDKTATEE